MIINLKMDELSNNAQRPGILDEIAGQVLIGPPGKRPEFPS